MRKLLESLGVWKKKEVQPKTLGAIAREQLQFSDPTSARTVEHIYRKVLEEARKMGDTRPDEEIFYIVALEVVSRAGEVCNQIHPLDFEARNKEYKDNEPLFLGALITTGENVGIFKKDEVSIETMRMHINNQVRRQSITKVQQDHI